MIHRHSAEAQREQNLLTRLNSITILCQFLSQHRMKKSKTSVFLKELSIFADDKTLRGKIIFCVSLFEMNIC